MYALVLTGIITLGRFSYRIVRGRVHKSQNKKNGTRVMIIGAGDAGNTVIKEITNSHFSTMVIKCIIDDNENNDNRDTTLEYEETLIKDAAKRCKMSEEGFKRVLEQERKDGEPKHRGEGSS